MGNEMSAMDLQEMNVILRITKDVESITVTARLKDENCGLTYAKRFFAAREICSVHQKIIENIESFDDNEGLCVLTDASREYLKTHMKGGFNHHGRKGGSQGKRKTRNAFFTV